MSCGRIKIAAIARNVLNVLAPFVQEQLVADLKAYYYFSVSSNASNTGNIKTFLYTVQFFFSELGKSKKLLDFYEDPHESSKDIYNRIQERTLGNELKMKQISLYSADNASVNSGKHNSVFQKLKDNNNHLIKANFNCHVINNCVNYAFKALSVDVESIVIKTFNKFS